MVSREILKQNPVSLAPQKILDTLKIIEVVYYGFDTVLHQGQIVVHRDVAREVRGFFEWAQEMRFPIEKVVPISAPQYAWDDEQSCEDNNSSGYNYRTIAGSSELSKHARGYAFDINPRQNVYLRYDAEGNEMYRSPQNAVYDTRVAGTLTSDHPLVLHMKKLGWTWGGDWKKESGRIDYQHFEKAQNAMNF